MRIHSLRIKGIGPYRQEHYINFDEFQSGKFLITGNTGAGKSILIDAICFALYGRVTSTSKLSETRLRSRLCSSDDESFSEVIFSTSSGVYRVHRSPTYERTKKRGTGTTTVNTKVSLYKLSSPEARANDAFVTGAAAVGNELARILPFNVSQFLQTIVLPQGHFAGFLKATSDERKKILQTVFGTEIFEQIETRLENEAKAATKASADAWNRVEASSKSLTSDNTIGQIRETDERARALLSLSAARIATELERNQILSESVQECKRAVQERKDRLAHARKHNAICERREAILTDLFNTAMTADTTATLRYLLERDRQAAPVLDAQRLLAETTRRIKKLEDTAPRDDNGTILSTIEAKQTQLAAAAAVDRIKRLLERADQLSVLIKDIEKLEIIASKYDKIIATKQLSVTEKETEKESCTIRLTELNDVASALLEAQETLQNLKSEQRLHEDIANTETDIIKAKAAAKDAEKPEKTAITAVEVAMKNWSEAAASTLASALKTGHPCPVCGAKKHPHLATANVGERNNEQSTQNYTAILQAANAAASKAQAELLSAMKYEQEISKRRRSLAQPKISADELKLQLDAAIQAHTEASAQMKERELLLAKKTELDQKLTIAQRDATEASEKNVKIRQQLALLQGQAQQLRADLIDEVDSAEIQSKLAQAEADFNAAKANLDTVMNLESTKAELLRHQEHLNSVLANSGFKNANEARWASIPTAKRKAWELVSTPPTTRIAELKKHLHSKEIQTVRDTCTIVLEPLSDSLIKAETYRDSVLRLSASSTTILNTYREEHKELITAVKTWRTQTQQHADLILLHRLIANKDGADRLSMPLSTWVLTKRLEQVLEVATPKLLRISDGQFEFIRTSSDGSQTKNQGLSVGLYDIRTDAVVAPGSLSGGQQFIASLALALALIEVVQSEAGGVSIGTMFIDEGFGSLDSHRLATVLDQLSMETQNDRTIGIISHVEELKRSINDRIVVTNNSKGEATLTVYA